MFPTTPPTLDSIWVKIRAYVPKSLGLRVFRSAGLPSHGSSRLHPTLLKGEELCGAVTRSLGTSEISDVSVLISIGNNFCTGLLKWTVFPFVITRTFAPLTSLSFPTMRPSTTAISQPFLLTPSSYTVTISPTFGAFPIAWALQSWLSLKFVKYSLGHLFQKCCRVSLIYLYLLL